MVGLSKLFILSLFAILGTDSFVLRDKVEVERREELGIIADAFFAHNAEDSLEKRAKPRVSIKQTQSGTKKPPQKGKCKRGSQTKQACDPFEKTEVGLKGTKPNINPMPADPYTGLMDMILRGELEKIGITEPEPGLAYVFLQSTPGVLLQNICNGGSQPVYSVRVHSLRQRAGKTSYNAYDWDDEQAFVAIDRHYLALGKASLAMKPARLNAKIKEDSDEYFNKYPDYNIASNNCGDYVEYMIPRLGTEHAKLDYVLDYVKKVKKLTPG